MSRTELGHLSLVALVGFLLAFALRAEALRAAEARQVTVAVYSREPLAKVAVLKAERIFTEKRRLGFFRVKLFPLLVAQGVRLELGQSTPNTNWPASFRVRLASLARNQTMEWRDFSIWLPGQDTPRLRARRLWPVPSAGPECCELEGVTLQTEAGPVEVPRARVQLEGAPGRVVWQTDGEPAQWDLFTGQFISEKTNTKTINLEESPP